MHASYILEQVASSFFFFPAGRRYIEVHVGGERDVKRPKKPQIGYTTYVLKIVYFTLNVFPWRETNCIFSITFFPFCLPEIVEMESAAPADAIERIPSIHCVIGVMQKLRNLGAS